MSINALRMLLVNAPLYLVTCALVGTGLLLELRMDEEDGVVRLFGMGRDDWGENHIAIALVFVGLTVLHLVVNWGWIKSARAKTKWVVPVVALGLAIIAALLMWPAGDHPVNGRATTGDHRRDQD
jgi:hypothetical protein